LKFEELPQKIRELMEEFDRAGYELVVVGGAVRSFFAGEEPTDWDLSTSATPEEMLSLSKEKGIRTIPTGIQHGTLTWIVDGLHLEITTYRIEGTYEGYRRPLEMTFTKDLNRDLARRDFTMNAMAYDYKKGLLDPFGGRADFHKKILRAVGDPKIRLAEDALRSFRAVRFATRYGLVLDQKLQEALESEGEKVRHLSGERIKQELDQILEMEAWKSGVSGLLKFRLLRDWIPVWSHLYGEELINQPMAVSGRLTRFAALMLLSDAELEESDWALVRLRASKEERKRMRSLLTHDPRIKRPIQTAYEARRLVLSLGKPILDPWLDLYRNWQGETEEARLIRRVAGDGSVLELKELAIDGRDLIELGFCPGPQLGELLEICLDLVLQSPEKNTKEVLLAAIKKRGCIITK
jgi:tRNA nucleotidyltransferase (CCA-adding enzyme)